jgi:hypothetical protein
MSRVEHDRRDGGAPDSSMRMEPVSETDLRSASESLRYSVLFLLS